MNIHTIIEECEVGNSAFVFYIWLKSKFHRGAKMDDLLEYGIGERQVKRYLQELTEADLIEVKPTGNRNQKIYTAI